MEDQGRAHGGTQIQHPAGEAGIQQTAHMNDPKHVVETALADHEAAVPTLFDHAGDLRRVVLDIEPDQLDARRHDRAYRAVGEA
jgi:hypothetical protein